MLFRKATLCWLPLQTLSLSDSMFVLILWQKKAAKRDGVDIRLYRIIYDAIEEITTAMKGMLAPKFREVILGKAEVRQVYKISNVGAVAGSYITDGKITRNCEIRVVRDGIVVAEDKTILSRDSKTTQKK